MGKAGGAGQDCGVASAERVHVLEQGLIDGVQQLACLTVHMLAAWLVGWLISLQRGCGPTLVSAVGCEWAVWLQCTSDGEYASGTCEFV